jgi:hypothetical protein
VAGRVAEARLRVPQGGRDALAECARRASGARLGGQERPVVRGMANVAAPAVRGVRLGAELVERREVVRRCDAQGGGTRVVACHEAWSAMWRGARLWQEQK